MVVHLSWTLSFSNIPGTVLWRQMLSQHFVLFLYHWACDCAFCCVVVFKMSARKVHGIWWHGCICVFVSLQLCICIPVVVVWQFLGKAQKEGARYQVTWQWLNSRWQDLPSHRSEPQIHISLRSWKESQCSRYQLRENHIFDYQLFSWGLLLFFSWIETKSWYILLA